MNSNIRKLRNEKNISQSKLADILGKTQQTISHMERDRDRIPIETLITLADYFDVTTDYILGVEPKGRSGGISEVTAYRETKAAERFRSQTAVFSDTPGENREILYQLILSLLLYSLENDGEAMPEGAAGSV